MLKTTEKYGDSNINNFGQLETSIEERIVISLTDEELISIWENKTEYIYNAIARKDDFPKFFEKFNNDKNNNAVQIYIDNNKKYYSLEFGKNIRELTGGNEFYTKLKNIL